MLDGGAVRHRRDHCGRQCVLVSSMCGPPRSAAIERRCGPLAPPAFRMVVTRPDGRSTAASGVPAEPVRPTRSLGSSSGPTAEHRVPAGRVDHHRAGGLLSRDATSSALASRSRRAARSRAPSVLLYVAGGTLSVDRLATTRSRLSDDGAVRRPVGMGGDTADRRPDERGPRASTLRGIVYAPTSTVNLSSRERRQHRRPDRRRARP